MKYFIILIALFVLTSCSQECKACDIALYWENTLAPHPERKPWSAALNAEVEKSLQTYDKMTDINQVCPKYSKLTKEQKVKAISEIFVSGAFYESGFKPAALMRECRKDKCVYSSCRLDPEHGYCMKGGHKLDGYTVVSRGLMQLSLESAIGYGCNVKNPDDLHDPIKNLICANKIMASQKLIMNPKGYWAVYRPENKSYPLVLARIKKNAKVCF